MQRFTAAHELGHHELGHESHVDDETSIEGSSNDPQELQAQTFAASLLMSEVAVRPTSNDSDATFVARPSTRLTCTTSPSSSASATPLRSPSCAR